MGKDKNRTAAQNADADLDDSYVSESAKTKKNKKDKRIDFISKIICVIIAVFVWFYVMQVESPEYKHTFEDVEIKLSGAEMLEKERGLSVYSGYGRTVDITVSGKKSVVGRQSSDDIRVTADISNITSAGEYEVALNVSLPDGLDLVETEYEKISVYADEKSSVTVRLKAETPGFTKSGEFDYGATVLEFDSVVVTGPKNEIDNIDHAVVTLDLTSMGVIKQTVSATRSVKLVDADNNPIDNPYIKLSNTEAQVTIPVYTEKVVPLRVDWFYGYLNENNVNVILSPSEVRVKGDPATLDRMDFITVATIDEKTLDANSIRNYTLESGGDYTIMGGTEVRLSIKHIGTETRKYRVTNLSVESGDNTAEILDDYLMITLRGTPEVLDSITERNISVKADVSSYDAEYTGNVQTEAEITIDGVFDGSAYEVGIYSLRVKVN